MPLLCWDFYLGESAPQRVDTKSFSSRELCVHVFGTNARILRVINDRWHLFGSLITQQLHLIRIIMISLWIREISNHAHICMRAQSHILKGECIFFSPLEKYTRRRYKWCDLGQRTTWIYILSPPYAKNLYSRNYATLVKHYINPLFFLYTVILL